MAGLVVFCALNAQGYQKQTAKSAPPAAPSLAHQISSLDVPRLATAPKLADFEGMEPASSLARKMLKIEKFIQRDPKDGAPVSQHTEAYLGYTDKNLYIVFLAFDNNPKLMRARMLRRELIDDDDQCGFFLDTFHDRRHAYAFYANPYGIQQDALYSEATGPDQSFDTLWHTFNKITSHGYILGFEIPFKSLRFDPSPTHTFGVILARVIPRSAERAYYPENSSRSQGWLVHEGDIGGFDQISPGRNMQFIPYTSLGAFRSLDGRDPAGERFTGKHVAPKAGLDSKIVVKDSLVFDSTINP
ncbi:MAG TPA: carbohydrate binding family 9 domain-containing protein, partial [Candidatus Angelobacter sp.]|nr:carbohydrate binding family 9 domain-containing protein [Candidatus Angelobacter sp.]